MDVVLYCAGHEHEFPFLEPPHSCCEAHRITRAVMCDTGVQDGSNVDGVDVVLYCTGYEYEFPFLDLRLVCTTGGWVRPLHRALFVPGPGPPLALVGLPQLIVPFPLCQMQARRSAHVVPVVGQFCDATPLAHRLDGSRKFCRGAVSCRHVRRGCWRRLRSNATSWTAASTQGARCSDCH